MLAAQTCYPQLLSGPLSMEMDSFYIMLTTNYIFQMLYTGKYIPYFMIRINYLIFAEVTGHVERYVLVKTNM